MPTYGYRCKSCAEELDLMRPISESGEPAQCPACGAEAKRLFHPVGVHFKGSGFHNTDYKPKPKEEATSSSSSSTKPSDSKSSDSSSKKSESGGAASSSSTDASGSGSSGATAKSDT